MIQSNLLRLFFFILLIGGFLLDGFSQAYTSESEVNLSLIEGFGPRGVSSIIIPELSEVDETTKNILKDYVLDGFQEILDKKEYLFFVNEFQFFYQEYKKGNCSKNVFFEKASSNNWVLDDTMRLSTQPLKNVIRILTGKKASDDNNYICIIDANQDGSYGDDVIHYIPKLRTIGNENTQTVPIELEFYINNRVAKETINIAPSFGFEGRFGLSFHSFYFRRIRYNQQKFIICADFLNKQALFILPDLPYFVSIPRNKRVFNFSKIVFPSDTLTVFHDFYNNVVHFEDKNGKKVDIEVESREGDNNFQVAEIKSKFKNIQGESFLNGESISLNGRVSKWILLYFWSDNCGPCLQSLPLLNSIQKRYSKNLDLIGVVDVRGKRDAFLNILKENKVNWHNISLPKDNEIMKFYNIYAYPTICLIKPNGEIEKKYLSTAELEDVLRVYL